MFRAAWNGGLLPEGSAGGESEGQHGSAEGAKIAFQLDPVGGGRATGGLCRPPFPWREGQLPSHGREFPQSTGCNPHGPARRLLATVVGEYANVRLAVSPECMGLSIEVGDGLRRLEL